MPVFPYPDPGSTVAGGLRRRLIKDSLYYMVKDALTQLGWFNLAATVKPFVFLNDELDWRLDIQPNLVVLSDEGWTNEDAEMGSALAQNRQDFYIDFYSETDVLAAHFIGDVRDILEGRLPAIGRQRPYFTVLDYAHATPVELFTCGLEDVVVERSRDLAKPWATHWRMCRVTVVDYYGSTSDS